VGKPIAQAEPAKSVTVNADSVVAFVKSCRKPNGAFGPFDQEYTDAAWNYPALKTLSLLGEKIAEPEKVLQHGLGFPPGHGGYGHWQFFHEHQIRNLLGKPIEPEHRRVELVFQGYEPHYYGSPFGSGGASQFKAAADEKYAARDRTADRLGYYNLSSLYYLLAGMKASGREPTNGQSLIDFIVQRQAPNGGFVDVRVENLRPIDEDAHVAHTFQAVAALQLLGAKIPKREMIVDFVHTCQHDLGGYQASTAKSRMPELYFTWCALELLDILDQPPQRMDFLNEYLHSLQNSDGGFGSHPFGRSQLYGTLYAVESLKLLSGDARKGIVARPVQVISQKPISAGKFGIYQALFKVPVLQPEELAGLSKRGFHLLGIKSDKFEDADKLLAVIREQKLAMDVVLTPEAYPHRLQTRGGLMLNHVGNFSLDPRWTGEQKGIWHKANEVGKAGKSWTDYRREVLEPLRTLGCLMYPEQDFEMEHSHDVYDQAGYNAMLAGFNWEPRDFMRVFPWRERFLDMFPVISDADAHGDLAKWSPQLDHTRMLFIAHGPTYRDFLDAVRDRRMVCVIAQPAGVAKGFTCYGSPAAVEYVTPRVSEWQWWPKADK